MPYGETCASDRLCLGVSYNAVGCDSVVMNQQYIKEKYTKQG